MAAFDRPNPCPSQDFRMNPACRSRVGPLSTKQLFLEAPPERSGEALEMGRKSVSDSVGIVGRGLADGRWLRLRQVMRSPSIHPAQFRPYVPDVAGDARDGSWYY